MLIEHRGSTPHVHPSAYVAPTAVLCGAVSVGPQARILFGAVLTAEDGEISVGARSVVMENALVRARARAPGRHRRRRAGRAARAPERRPGR